MADVEEFLIGVLQHEYNPVAAKEYYERTKQLKGRTPGVVETPKGRPVASPKQTSAQKNAAAAKAKKERAARLQREAEARVAALKVRLAKLNDILDRLREESKKRAGVEPTSTTAKSTFNAKDAKPLTAAQKRDAAKASQKRRDKEGAGDPSLAVEAKELAAKIKKVEEAIARMKAQIAAARSKTQSKTAKKGR